MTDPTPPAGTPGCRFCDELRHNARGKQQCVRCAASMAPASSRRDESWLRRWKDRVLSSEVLAWVGIPQALAIAFGIWIGMQLAVGLIDAAIESVFAGRLIGQAHHVALLNITAILFTVVVLASAGRAYPERFRRRRGLSLKEAIAQRETQRRAAALNPARLARQHAQHAAVMGRRHRRHKRWAAFMNALPDSKPKQQTVKTTRCCIIVPCCGCGCALPAALLIGSVVLGFVIGPL